MTKSFSIYIPGIVALIVLVVGFVVAQAFTPPTVAPPGGNVPAPLNVGPASQTKDGNLALNVLNLFANGLLVPFGNVGIGTAGPLGMLHVGGKLVVLGDVLVDADGSTTTGVGTATAIAENAALVSAAGQSLCTNSLTAPVNLRIDANNNCADTGADTILLGTGAGTVAVTSAWAFSDTITVNGVYNNGEDIYIDNDPKLVYSSGNVGIGTTSPTAKLDVLGTINATKLTVGTIDPVYEIDGKKYATYVSDIAGGVKTEVTGKFEIRPFGFAQGENSKFEIDFDTQQVGSDLWLFWETSTKNVGDIAALLTPGFDGRVWYEKDASSNRIIIKSNNNGEVSFRFTAPREDAAQWPNEITE